MRDDDILERIRRADMVLVGLGEEFDGTGFLRQDDRYARGCGLLKEEGLHWLIPAWNRFCTEKSGGKRLEKAFERLASLLKDKNHFLVSVSTESRVSSVGRAVMPCGSYTVKQCAEGCSGVLPEATQQDRERLRGFFEALYEGAMPAHRSLLTGVCPECGAPLILNNIYAENYNEEGYLDQWKLYTKWLQGTLNHNLFILELGVGMKFPSVIRWPFEKAAFFNKKAYFCRINEKLYQLTKELSEKGCGFSKNAIDWLEELC